MADLPNDLFKNITVRLPLRAQQSYWNIIRVLGAEGQEFVLNDVYMRTFAARPSIAEFVRRLTKAKYLKPVRSVKKHGSIKEKYYVVLKNVNAAPRLKRDGTEVQPKLTDFMWRAMKMLPPFDAHELVRVCEIDGRKIALETAKYYLKCLNKAGYLRVHVEHTHNALAIYQFVKSKNTGHYPPLVLRTKVVWDQNIEKVMGEYPEFEEAA